jgi:hypothetical protein
VGGQAGRQGGKGVCFLNCLESSNRAAWSPKAGTQDSSSGDACDSLSGFMGFSAGGGFLLLLLYYCSTFLNYQIMV